MKLIFKSIALLASVVFAVMVGNYVTGLGAGSVNATLLGVLIGFVALVVLTAMLWLLIDVIYLVIARLTEWMQVHGRWSKSPERR